MELSIVVNREWFPIVLLDYMNQQGNDYGLSIALHSPNILPQMLGDDFIEAKFGTRMTISYSETLTKLLPPHYNTRCMVYDVDREHFNYTNSILVNY
jgi:hypothetical protein